MGETCRETVSNGLWSPLRPCGKPAKVTENGRHYCGVHDPAKRRARDAAREAKWQADRERARRVAAIDEAKRVVLDACRAEHEARTAFLAPASPDTTAIAYSEATDARIAAVAAWLALDVANG